MKFIKFLKRYRVAILWIICLIAIFYLTLLFKPSSVKNKLFLIPNLDKFVHFVMFYSIALLGAIVILKKFDDSKKLLLANFVLSVLLGGLTELFQPYFGRGASMLDFFADIAGVIVATLTYKFVYFRVIKKIL